MILEHTVGQYEYVLFVALLSKVSTLLDKKQSRARQTRLRETQTDVVFYGVASLLKLVIADLCLLDRALATYLRVVVGHLHHNLHNITHANKV